MNDFPLFPGLGRSLTDHEVARYLGVDVRLVRKYFARLGGMRLGRKYVFFEKGLVNALQAQIGLDGGSGYEGLSQAASMQDQKGGFGLGRANAQAGFAGAADKHAVLA